MKHQNRISPGLLLLDTFLRPIYVNDEAVSILSYPQAPRGNGHRAYFLKQRIDSLLPQRNGSRDPKFSGEFASGRRRYQVRVFGMKFNSQNHSGPTLAVLLERNREHADRLRAARQFHLTHRETAALEFLMQGYTTKQIACQFLLEAVLVPASGGIAGVLIGVGGMQIVARLQKLPQILLWEPIVTVILVAIGTGLLFGIYPAWKASRVEPSQALRS